MNTAYEQQEVDSAVQSLDPFYHHHEKRLLDTALNLLIDRFIDLFTDTVQFLDFGYIFFFPNSNNPEKREQNVGFLPIPIPHSTCQLYSEM